MTYNTQTVNLRELIADEENKSSFIEIDENTPLPETENSDEH